MGEFESSLERAKAGKDETTSDYALARPLACSKFVRHTPEELANSGSQLNNNG